MEIKQYDTEQQMHQKIKEKRKNNLKANKKSTTYQNLTDAVREFITEKFIEINMYIKKKKISSKQPNLILEGNRERKN